MAVTADRVPALLPPLLLLFLLSTADPSSSQISPSPPPGMPAHISLAPSPLPTASSPFSAAPLPGNSMSSLASSSSSSAPAPLEPARISLAPSPLPLASSLPSPAPLPGSPLPLLAPLSSSALPNEEIRTGSIETAEMVEADERGEGWSGNKTGIAVGVIAAAAALAWMGAAVYRKRRQNIRRARYGSATRREIL